MASEDPIAPQSVVPPGSKLSLEEAVNVSKHWLATTLADEKVKNIGLEEFNHQDGYWTITLGFSRAWDNVHNAMSVISGEVTVRRAYKVLTVNERTGDVVAMRHRDS